MDQKTKIEAAGFFRKEYSKLKNYIRSYISDKSDWDAEDIIQDVALNLFSRVDFETPVENLAEIWNHYPGKVNIRHYRRT